MNNNFAVEVTTSDNSALRAEFYTSNPTRKYERTGLANPKTTHCLVWQSGSLLSTGTVVKSHLDEDNDKQARLRSAQKAFRSIPVSILKEDRSKLWNALLADEQPEA